MKTNDLGKLLALLPKQTVSGSEAVCDWKDGSGAGAVRLPNPELLEDGTGS